MKIGQVEKKNREQSLNGGRCWERRSVDMLKETRVVVLIEGSGGHENGEASWSQIIRVLYAILKNLNFILQVKESKGNRLKQCYSKYGPWISRSQQMVHFHSVISTVIKRIYVYKLLKPSAISMISRHAINE